MGNSVRLGAIIAPRLPERANRGVNMCQLRHFGRFLPLPPRGGVLRLAPTVVRTEGNEHPALPGAERPGEAARAGAHALSDAELVALLLLREPGRSGVELARSLIADFGSLPSC